MREIEKGQSKVNTGVKCQLNDDENHAKMLLPFKRPTLEYGKHISGTPLAGSDATRAFITNHKKLRDFITLAHCLQPGIYTEELRVAV